MWRCKAPGSGSLCPATHGELYRQIGARASLGPRVSPPPRGNKITTYRPSSGVVLLIPEFFVSSLILCPSPWPHGGGALDTSGHWTLDVGRWTHDKGYPLVASNMYTNETMIPLASRRPLPSLRTHLSPSDVRVASPRPQGGEPWCIRGGAPPIFPIRTQILCHPPRLPGGGGIRGIPKGSLNLHVASEKQADAMMIPPPSQQPLSSLPTEPSSPTSD